MTEIKVEDVVAAYVNEHQIACHECLEKDEWNKLKADNILTREDLDNEDKIFFCDCCKKKL